MTEQSGNDSKAEPSLADQVGVKAARKLKAQRNTTPGVWFGLGLMGVVGWSVVVPTLLGAKLYHGISEVRFRQIVLGMLTLSGLAMLVASVPKVLGRLG